jgi:orotate phosphoribosyltransferase
VNQAEVMSLMIHAGAIITNSHVVYTSGKHGTAYVNKDALYPHTKVTSELCLMIAQNFVNSNVQVVIAPAIGGVILSQWTAYHLSALSGYEVFGVYAEKNERSGGFFVGRGYDTFIRGRKVLVVEDVLTTGGSASKVIAAVREIGGEVAGLGVLCNRGGIESKDVGRVPKLVSLVDVSLDAWDEEDCPMCARGVPINTELGKGREYVARKIDQSTQLPG